MKRTYIEYRGLNKKNDFTCYFCDEEVGVNGYEITLDGEDTHVCIACMFKIFLTGEDYHED